MLAVKPDLPQPDIGHVLDALAKHRSVEFDCRFSPRDVEMIEVESRIELEGRLVELFPFRPHMAPVDDPTRVAVSITLVGGPPISGEGENVDEAIQSLLHNALSYTEHWEHHLRFSTGHQRYWGWVYRLLLAGDEEHVLATLLNRSI